MATQGTIFDSKSALTVSEPKGYSQVPHQKVIAKYEVPFYLARPWLHLPKMRYKLLLWFSLVVLSCLVADYKELQVHHRGQPDVAD